MRAFLSDEEGILVFQFLASDRVGLQPVLLDMLDLLGQLPKDRSLELVQ